MKKIKLGVIGLGRGGHVAHQITQITEGRIEIGAVVDISNENYQSACKEYHIKPVCYSSVDEMLKKEKPDAALIGTPNEFHLQNLESFRGMNIPLLLEKPLDSTFEKICGVVRFAATYKAPILVGHCMRYAPILRCAKEIIQSGGIGKICSTRFTQNCHYGNLMYHNWRRNREKSGTMFLEKATHDIDIMQWLIEAKPVTVMAAARLQAYGGNESNDLRCSTCEKKLSCPENYQAILHRWGIQIPDEAKSRQDFCSFARETDTPDNEVCLIQFDNNTFGTYTECFFTPRSYHHRVYEVHGTLGAMEIDLGETEGEILLCKRYGSNKDDVTFRFDYLGRNHYNGDGEMARHFYQVICGNEKPHSTVKQAFMAELTGYAAVKSSLVNENLKAADLVPEDLKSILKETLF